MPVQESEVIRLSAGGTLRKMCRNTNYVSEEPDKVQALTSSFGIHTVSKISSIKYKYKRGISSAVSAMEHSTTLYSGKNKRTINKTTKGNIL